MPPSHEMVIPVYMLYKNRPISNADEFIKDEKFDGNSILYVFLLPPLKKSAQRKDNSFEFYQPTEDFWKCTNVLLRICKRTEENNYKYSLISIENPETKITLGVLIKKVFDKFQPYRDSIFYDSRKLSPDLCLSDQDCQYVRSHKRIPIILDIIIEKNQQPDETNERHATTELMKCDMIRPSLNVEWQSTPTELSVHMYPFTLYIRLRLDAAIRCLEDTNTQQNKNDNDGNGEDNKKKKKRLSDLLMNFYLFCDKDKSAKLDPGEQKVGLLTLFKYIENEDMELTADRLPETINEENNMDEKGFRRLIIDTLTTYLCFRAIQYQNAGRQSPLNETNKDIDTITKNIEGNLKNNLQRKPEYQGPFSVINIFKHIGLFLLCFLFLPITVFYTIFHNRPKGPNISTSKVGLTCLIIFISIITAVLSCIIYLIIAQIILYYIYRNETLEWHISPLEVFWPFSLLICIVFIAYLYAIPLSEHSDYNKNKQLKEYSHEAQMDILKQQAKVIVFTGKKRTEKLMVEWEAERNKSSKNQTDFGEKSQKHKNRNKKKNNNYWRKLIGIASNIYQFEKEHSSGKARIVKLVILIVIVIIAVLHACIPTIYRSSPTDYTFPTNETKRHELQLIEVAFIIVDIIIYLIFLLMIMYAYYLFDVLGYKLNRVMEQTANSNNYNVVDEDACYLDLKKTINLDLFLAQIRKVFEMKNKIEYQLALTTLGAALLIDIILGIVAVIRLITRGSRSFTTLTGIYILIDIILLSLMSIILLIKIAFINSTGTKDVQDLLVRTKREILVSTAGQTIDEKSQDIGYIDAMSEQLAANQHRYAIAICGFIVDKTFVLDIALVLVGEVVAALAAEIQDKVKGD